MKLITLTTLLASVICQDAIIRTDAGPIAFNEDSSQCLDISGTAISAETQHRAKIILFKNRNCGRGRYAWARGYFNFRPYYQFNSARIIPYRPILYGDSNGNSKASAQSNDSDEQEGGGEAEGEPSFYHTPSYYYNY